MKKIIILQGLPASGKSTWAKQIIADNPGVYKRVNKDDLRAMLDGGKWSSDNEKFILMARDSLIILALSEGKHVIVDDTNLHPKHVKQITELGKHFDAESEIKFFEVTVEEAIKRDLKRSASVGESVIRKMYDDFLAPKVEPLVQDASLPHCVIVDIDGTICKMNGRSPYEWDKVHTDTANQAVCKAVQQLANKYAIIFLSGRDGSCREATEIWIQENVLAKSYYQIFTRSAGDMRKDCIIKRELFDANIRDKYFVEFVLDDRNQVVDLWRREIGLPCFQVDYGNF